MTKKPLYRSLFKEIKVWKIKFGILAAHFISKQVKKKKKLTDILENILCSLMLFLSVSK